MLIVVAIIAILVAIAIPVFSTQLEKAREASDAANIRAAYAEVMTAFISGNTDEDGLTGVEKTDEGLFFKVVELQQKKDGWQTSDIREKGIGGMTGDGTSPSAGKSATVYVSGKTDAYIVYGTAKAAPTKSDE